MKALAVLIIICGMIFQSVALLKTGRTYDFGIGYWGPLARDGVWHEALVGQMHIPPNNPGFAGERLVNYHYFYDLLVAATAKLTGLEIRFLIYEFYPLIFSLTLGIGTYWLGKRLFKNNLAVILSLYLVYFGSSFGWVLEFIKRGSVWGGESTFWANQPVSMNLNPPFAVSLGLLVFAFLAFDVYLAKPSRKTMLVLILLAGLLVGFKVYAGIILLGAMGIVTAKKVFFDKNYSLLLPFLASTFLAAIIFLPQMKLGESLISFKPFWLMDSMIDLTDRVGWLRLSQARAAYQAEGNWIKLFAVEGVSLIIFLVGNLGTRIIGFAGLRKNLPKKDLPLLMLVAAAISLVLPLLFVQKGNPWNIVQFFYYFLFLTAFLAGFQVAKIYRQLPRPLAFVFLLAFVLLTPISSLATFRSWLYPRPPAYISSEELQALNFLQETPAGVVLKHPFDQSLRQKYSDPYPIFAYADSAYVSAFSQKPSFLEDVEQQIILGTDYQGRLTQANRFFVEKDLAWSKDFLQTQNISYLYLPKVFNLPMAEEEYPMHKIFENSEVRIFEVE
jgi:hypothetical protein